MKKTFQKFVHAKIFAHYYYHFFFFLFVVFWWGGGGGVLKRLMAKIDVFH